MRPDPETPVAILGDGVHGIARESLFDGVGCEPAIAAPAQPTVERSHPEVPVPVLVYRQDDVAREPLRLPEDSELPGAQLVQPAAVGPNPQVSPAVFVDRPHEVVRQPVLCREGREPAIPPPAQTAAVCADPEIPLGVLAERKHHIVRQAVPGRIRGERPVFRSRQPAAIRADPEAPVSRGEESHDIAVRERGGIGRVEDREADTVEPYDAGLRREPQVAVGGLGNGLDRVLRQPVLHQPGGMGELREGLRGIEGERLGMPQRSQRDAGRGISYDLHQGEAVNRRNVT